MKNFVSRRTAIGLIGLVPLMLSAKAGLAQSVATEALLAGAKEEGKVVVYSIFPTTVETEMMQMYQDATGVSMEYSRIGGTNPTLQKFYSQVKVGQHLTDVIVLEKSASMIAAAEGLFAEVRPAAIENVAPAFRSVDGLAQTVVASFHVVVYNKNLVTEDQLPKEWTDLTKPEYAGKVVVGSPENSGSATVMIKTLLDRYGWDFFKSLAENGLIETTREVEAADLVARGERLFAVISQTAPAAQLAAGAPIGIYFPPRPIVTEFAASVPAEAPHPNAGRHFLNYMLSEDYQKRVVSDLAGYSVLTTVAPPEGLPALSELAVEPFDYEDLRVQRDSILETWREVMGG